MNKYRTVLTIAGSDSGGGAGIQADIKTISACKCFATSVITAVTVQNTLGVFNIHSIPTNIVSKQISAVLDDIGANSIKIGMLNNADTIITIKETLLKYKVSNIVLDPVMLSTSGKRLLSEDAIKELINFIPNVRVVTPNIPEVEVLLNTKVNQKSDLLSCAATLGKKYRVSVLLKAGHLSEEVLTDVFYNCETDELLQLKASRVNTKNTHGTGCVLSSALASFLAQGQELNVAVKNAKQFINNAIVRGADYELGKGKGAVFHFWESW